MKRVLIMLTIVVLATINIFGQTLNSNAKKLKVDNFELYSKIKSSASEKWGNNYEMVVYRINNQITALYEIDNITHSPGYDEDLMVSAVVKWSKFNGNDEIISSDYEMILYTYRNQIKAKNSF